MPKITTFPTLYDECKHISISDLKRWGYLNPGQIKSGIITWSIWERKTGCIRIYVNTQTENPFIELDYKYNDKPVNYCVKLVSIPSNLGKGKVLYFLCPHTYKRCRKLYLVEQYFLHREAYKGCYYDKQIHSKYYRYLDKTLSVYFKLDQYYSMLYSKHFKTHYAKKPTKRYRKLLAAINRAESIPLSTIEKAFTN